MSFKGKNDTRSLKFLFQERAKYYSQALTNGNDRKSGVSDLNSFERVFYGKSNVRLESMFPKEEFIKSGIEIGTRNLHYVVDAFEGFRRDFQTTVLMASGDGSNGGSYDTTHRYLSKIKVYRSYESPEVKYEAYISKLVNEMLNEIKELGLTNNITDFNEFVNYFVNFLSKKGSTFPLTRTGFQKSTRTNIFTTGLAFSIANLDCGDDVDKSEFLSNEQNLNLYLQTAQNWGFAVSLICPWIMVANPVSGGSSKMTDALDDNEILNTGFGVFNITHETLYQSDIDNLFNILRLNYNLYISRFPVTRTIKFNGRKTTQSRFFRSEITADEVNEIYTEQKKIILYAKIRNIEENGVLNSADFSVLEQNSTFLLNKFDIQQAVSYINDTFRNSYVLKPGGLNDYLRRNAETE